MNGGGRLARSSRLSGFRSDLLAVALAVAALVRRKLTRPKRPAPSPLERPQQPNGFIALVEKYLPHRIGVALTLVVLLGSAGLGIVKGGHVGEFDRGRDAFLGLEQCRQLIEPVVRHAFDAP